MSHQKTSRPSQAERLSALTQAVGSATFGTPRPAGISHLCSCPFLLLIPLLLVCPLLKFQVLATSSQDDPTIWVGVQLPPSIHTSYDQQSTPSNPTVALLSLQANVQALIKDKHTHLEALPALTFRSWFLCTASLLLGHSVDLDALRHGETTQQLPGHPR